MKKHEWTRLQYLRQRAEAKKIRRQIHNQKDNYSRFDKPLKSKYTHFISKDDYKRVKTKEGVFKFKRNQIINFERFRK